MDLIQQINNHKYLYLDKLVESDDLKLELWIDEAGVKQDTNRLSGDASLYGSIETNEFSRRYKITFNDYIGYAVINESFTLWDDYEKFTGNLFRVYSKSRFLDYIKVTAEAFVIDHTQENKMKHFGICCLNHILNVATCRDMLIEVIA